MKVKYLGLAALATALTLSVLAPEAFARRGRGTDDGFNHARHESAGHSFIIDGHPSLQIARRGRGADDPAGHQRRCRGCDDGANHS